MLACELVEPLQAVLDERDDAAAQVVEDGLAAAHNVLLKAGSLLVIRHGAYSDRTNYDPVRVLRSNTNRKKTQSDRL